LWAAAGHQSLREITRDHVIAALPASGTPRAKLGRALQSIFATLRSRKVIFTNPLTRIHIGSFERRIPLPADPGKLAAALNSADPSTAAVAALMIFHGLRPAELRDLQLTGIRDGRCYLADRVVLLAGPVRTRLAAYLDYRYRRWPASINPTSSSTASAPRPPVLSARTGSTTTSACPPAPSARTAWSTRPSPPAGTCAGSATCSG
jgi:hypothetical protein